jgi:aminoglycoside/choline kinase family phosphotransferase
MDAPPEKESSVRFVTLSRLLRQNNICVPEIIALDQQQGFLLLTDFGDQLLESVLSPATVDRYYQQALRDLAALQRVPIEGPAYTAELLLEEMLRFDDWYVEQHLKRQLSEAERVIVEQAYQCLVESALAQPFVFVHRDFHCRNIMVLASKQLGILDYQDAVRGPVTYDLVSLLRDCYVDWPDHQIYDRVLEYYAYLRELGMQASDQEFIRWFDLMGVQRHLKAIGHFARLLHRDQKPHYLPYIPRVLNYITSACSRYPELRSFGRLIEGLQ